MPKKAAGSSSDVVAAIDSKVQGLIADIDAQIAQLEQKKATLVSMFGGSVVAAAAAPGVRRRGRPPGSANKKAAAKTTKKRVFSEETKKKLAVSAKARWARIHAAQTGKAAKVKVAKDKAA